MVLNDRTTLDGVIDRSPLTIAPSGLVLDAIALMNRGKDGAEELSSTGSRSGCVLVVEDRQLLGIFTAQDVVRLVAAGRELAGVKMAEVMTPQPITIKESEVHDISIALSLLQQHRICHLPVVDDRDRAIGIVTETSLLQALGSQARIDKPEQVPTRSLRHPPEKLEQINQQLHKEILAHQEEEDALRFSQERLQLALEGSGDGLWDWNISTGEVYLSPRWLEMLGYAADELPGDLSTWDKLIHPEDKSWVTEKLNAHLKDSSSPYAFDYRMRTKSGKWKWIANFGKVVARDRDGNPLRMAGTHRDISDRKQTEIRLREREEFVSNIYHGTEQAIFIVDVDATGEFRYIGFNHVSERYAGISNDQIQGKTPEEAFGNELGKALRQNYARCVQTVTSITYEEELAFAGRTIWTLTTLAPLQDERGRIYRIVGTATDITDRKRIEEALRESEERLRTALEAARMGTWDWNILTNKIDWSASLKHLFGLGESAEIVYETFVNLIYPEDRDKVLTTIANTFKSGEDYNIEFRFVLPNGAIRWAASQGRVFYDDDGKPIRMAGIDMDITDRKHIENELRESEERLQAMLNNSTSVIFVKDIQSRYILINHRYAELFHIDQATARGKTDYDFFPPEIAAAFQDNDRTVIESRTAIEWEELAPHEDGLHTYLSVKFPLIDTMGKVYAVCGIATDISDRKRAEENLKQSEARFRELAEIIDDVFYVVAPGGTQMLYISPAYEKIWGRTCESLYQQPYSWIEAIHPDDRERVLVAFKKQLQGVPLQEEYRIITASGKTRWIADRNFLIHDEHGELLRHVGMAVDITHRKLAETEMREMNAALENAAEGISRLDTQGRYITVNKAYADAVGCEPMEMVGKDWQATVHPSDLEKMLAAYQQMLKDGKVEAEARGVRKDGSVFYKQLVMVATYDERKQLTGHYCFMKDISDRKRQEEILRNIALGVSTNTGEAFFQALAEYATKALGTEYAFISELIAPANDSVRVIGGYGDGQRLDSFDYALTYTPCEHVVVNQPCMYVSRLQAQFPANQFLRDIRAESYIGIPLINSAGQVLGLICVLSHEPLQGTELMLEVMKIFAACASVELERQYAEKELQSQKQELTRSNAELEQFAYVASHDLQEPLRMVVSYLQLLERRYKDKLDASADEFIDYAVDGASRMQTLINDLLEYSRVNTRGQPFAPINCSHALDRALGNLKLAIAESRTVITCDPLPEIVADSTQIAQLLQNLIGNAIKFRGKLAPQIHIGAERQSDRWVFSVRDNGIGIEPQYRDRIFAVFQRLHNRVKYKGTGIGLAICKKIVERRGGSIWVESELDRGSTFYFTIPDRVEVT